MNTIAYQIGYNRCKLMSHFERERMGQISLSECARQLAKEMNFTKEEEQDCLDGMIDFLHYNRKKISREKQKEENRKKVNAQRARIKKESKLDDLLLLMAVVSGHHH